MPLVPKLPKIFTPCANLPTFLEDFPRELHLPNYLLSLHTMIIALRISITLTIILAHHAIAAPLVVNYTVLLALMMIVMIVTHPSHVMITLSFVTIIFQLEFG